MSVQMILDIQFPTWNNLSQQEKSFISFLMENSSIFFKARSVDSQTHKVSSFSAEVRDKLNFFTLGGWQYLFAVPYIDDDLNFNLQHIDEDSLMEINSVLTKADTALKLYHVSHAPSFEHDEEGFSVVEKAIAPFDNIPVKLIPKINGQENSNNSLIPSELGPDPMQSGLQECIDIPVDLDEQPEISFQLRSSSFAIADDQESHIVECYYKIGVCPLTNSWNTEFSQSSEGLSLSELVEYLKLNSLHIRNDDSTGIYAASLWFYKEGEYSEDVGNNQNNIVISRPVIYSDEEYDIGSIKTRYIIPLYKNNYIYALCYLQLFYNTGEKVEQLYLDSYSISDIGLKPTNGEFSYAERYENLSFLITDQNINSGYLSGTQII